MSTYIHFSIQAIAERVNRKVHVLRLHGQAASLLTQMETVQGELGQQLAGLTPARAGFSMTEWERTLNRATDRVHRLKQTLVQVDAQIRELKLEAIHGDLLTLQRDLSLGSAAIERLTVSHNCPVIGKEVCDLTWPSTVRLVTVFRGPFLIPPTDRFVFRADDIVIAIGSRADLDHIAPWFTAGRTGKA